MFNEAVGVESESIRQKNNFLIRPKWIKISAHSADGYEVANRVHEPTKPESGHKNILKSRANEDNRKWYKKNMRYPAVSKRRKEQAKDFDSPRHEHQSPPNERVWFVNIRKETASRHGRNQSSCFNPAESKSLCPDDRRGQCKKNVSFGSHLDLSGSRENSMQR